MKRRFMPSWFLAVSLALAATAAVPQRIARAQDEEPEMTFDEDEVAKPPDKNKAKSKAKSKAKPEAKPDGKPEAKPDAKGDAKGKAAPAAGAQTPAGAAQPGAAQPEPEPEPEPEGEVKLGADPTAEAASRQTELGENRVSWQDI